MFKHLDFRPLPGLQSPHTQMVMSAFGYPGQEPISETVRFTTGDGDLLACEISTPPQWLPHHPTIVLLHGLTGSHLSRYMISLARKFFHLGYRTVRINLRGCGSGAGINKLPYNSGNSPDVLNVLQTLKEQTPLSPITFLGFSLGGNIILKLAGELGERGLQFLEHIYALCPVLDLAHSVRIISKRSNWLYHRYFLSKMIQQGKRWVPKKKISSIHEFDDIVTAPLWGYKDADDYYLKCSSGRFMSSIRVPCEIILAADDPFIDYKDVMRTAVSPTTTVWLSPTGSHMGFIGQMGNGSGYYWLDSWLINKVLKSKEHFNKNY